VFAKMSLAEMAHVAEGLCLNALLTQKAEISLISLVGTRIPTVSMKEWQFILPLKALTLATPEARSYHFAVTTNKNSCQ
jgi:hypothetical protein